MNEIKDTKNSVQQPAAVGSEQTQVSPASVVTSPSAFFDGHDHAHDHDHSPQRPSTVQSHNLTTRNPGQVASHDHSHQNNGHQHVPGCRCDVVSYKDSRGANVTISPFAR